MSNNAELNRLARMADLIEKNTERSSFAQQELVLQLKRIADGLEFFRSVAEQGMAEEAAARVKGLGL